MQSLSGLGVLVTRPDTQAGPLCRLIESLGGTAVRLPAIEIRAHGERAALRASLGPLERYDLIVFVSANAVRFGAGLLEERRDLTLAAVGPATLRALNQAGYRVAILPSAGFDSEGLLADARLQSLAGRRVLIVKGVGGRDLLESVLAQRGAAVTLATVYERRRSAPDESQCARIAGLITDGTLEAVTATSLEIGASLVALGSEHPVLLAPLQQCHWVVPGERVAAGLRSLGLTAPLIVAASAEDQSLVDALVRWRSGGAGA